MGCSCALAQANVPESRIEMGNVQVGRERCYASLPVKGQDAKIIAIPSADGSANEPVVAMIDYFASRRRVGVRGDSFDCKDVADHLRNLNHHFHHPEH